jgi:hypothetical protein
MLFFELSVLYGDVGVIRVCIVGANGRTCFWGWGRRSKWGISNFLFFRVNVDVMWVYVVGANGPAPSYFGGLSEKIKNIL